MFFFFQVTKVERLENPELWQNYNRERGQMLHKLRSGDSSARCTPVKSLSNRGAVMTTVNIAEDGPLCREIYPEAGV